MTELRNAATQGLKPGRRNGERPIWVAVIGFVTGFVAVLTLGCGMLVWVVPGTKVNIDIGLDQWGMKAHVLLHRFGLGALLVGTGVWFTALTRGLWQGRRYGAVLGVITLALALAIAILVAVP